MFPIYLSQGRRMEARLKGARICLAVRRSSSFIFVMIFPSRLIAHTCAHGVFDLSGDSYHSLRISVAHAPHFFLVQTHARFSFQGGQRFSPFTFNRNCCTRDCLSSINIQQQNVTDEVRQTYSAVNPLAFPHCCGHSKVEKQASELFLAC